MVQHLPVAQLFSKKHKNNISIAELTPVDCNLCGKSTGENQKLFSEADKFDVMCCRGCNLLYVTPQPCHEDLHTYYDGFFSDAQNTTADEWHHGSTLTQVKKLLDQTVEHDSILEIGSGNGFFLRMAEKLEYKNIVGLEPDLKTCELIRKDLSSAEIVNCSFEDFTTDKKFSCIVMLASLEHFKNPSQILQKYHSLLKPNSAIVIRVPYWEGYFRLNRLFKRNIFPFGAPRHLYDFSPKTLSAFCQKSGFSVAVVEPGSS